MQHHKKPTDAERDELIATCEARLRSRLEAQGLLEPGEKPKGKRAADAECHFLAGAMTVIHAIFPNDKPDALSDVIPPKWIYGPLSGRSVLDPTE